MNEFEINAFEVWRNEFDNRSLPRWIYKLAESTYRTLHPQKGLVTPPPNNDNPLENHLRELWDDRFLTGTRFDEAYQPVSLEYRLYQIYGRSHVGSILKGEF